MKSFFNLALLLAACVSAAPAADNQVAELDDVPIPPGAKIIKYDGPKYEMKPEDWAVRAQAYANNQSWSAPAEMPRITLELGQALDLGVEPNTTLTKRRGARYIAAFGDYNCARTTVLTSVTNFGCGTGCITIPSSALSGVVSQQYTGNPYPTMDVWGGPNCLDIYPSQHFGVIGTSSCTNANNCCGFKSFIGYWNCHH